MADNVALRLFKGNLESLGRFQQNVMHHPSACNEESPGVSTNNINADDYNVADGSPASQVSIHQLKVEDFDFCGDVCSSDHVSEELVLKSEFTSFQENGYNNVARLIKDFPARVGIASKNQSHGSSLNTTADVCYTTQVAGRSEGLSPESVQGSNSSFMYKKRSSCSDESGNFINNNQKRLKKDSVIVCHLKKTCIGQGILRLSKSDELMHSDRVKLCHEVIVGEIGAAASKVISSSKFRELAEGIVALFPEENISTYFVPRKPATGSQNAVQPKGVLYDKYHNILKFLRRTGLRSSFPRGGGEISVREPDLHISLDIEWLKKYSTGSRVMTTVKWLNTAEHRISSLRETEDSVAKTKLNLFSVLSYFRTYGCLCERWGPCLLVQDFEFLYKGHYKPLVHNWRSIHVKLLHLAKKSEGDCPFNDVIPAMKLIPKMFKQPIINYGSKKQRKAWKPNSAESSQGFVLYVKTIGDLEIEISKMSEKCAHVKRSVQPLPAFIGPSENNIVKSLVVIDRQQYEMDSPLIAFDTCFKMYHSLHCQYPVQSSYSWLFVQQAIYGLMTDWDFEAPSVSTIYWKQYLDSDVGDTLQP